MAHGARCAVRAEGDRASTSCADLILNRIYCRQHARHARTPASAPGPRRRLNATQPTSRRAGEGGRNHDFKRQGISHGAHGRARLDREVRVEAALTDACRANGLFKDDGPKGVRDTLASGLRGAWPSLAKTSTTRRRRRTRLRALGDETARLLIEANENRPPETIVVDGVTIDAETGEIVEGVKAPRLASENSNGHAIFVARLRIHPTPPMALW